MNEDNLNNKEEEKIEQEAEETSKAIKDGANLAKNVATKNIGGAVKDAAKLAKNKTLRRKIIKHTIIKFIVPFIIVVFLASFVLGIFGAVGDVLQDIVNGIKDFFNIDFTDGSINIKDNQIDTIINSIESMGISAEDLKLLGEYSENATPEEQQEAMRKYIRQFYEAQAVTQTLNYYHKESTDTKTYGAIYVYRAIGESTANGSSRKELTYEEYDKMKEYQEKNSTQALEHYSVDDSGNLVVAGTNQVTEESGKTTTTIFLTQINYRSAISQYTTQMNFLVYLTMISQNPEFVSALVDLIKDSRIEITILDNVTTNIETKTYEYTVNERKEYKRTDDQGNEFYYYNNTKPEKKQEVTKTTVVNTLPTFKITYVKTWFCEQRITYNRIDKEPTNSSYELTEKDDESLKDDEAITGNNEGEWITDKKETYESERQETVYEEGIREEVKITLGQSGDGKRYANKEIEQPTFIGLMETEFRIPHSTRKEAAGSNLISGAEMLFYLLQKDPNLENMEQIMRYAFNIYLGYERFETELDLSIFEIGDFANVVGIYGDTIQEKVWFTLRDAGYSEYAVAGVMGNIEAESGFRPTAIEGGTGIGAGLCQWSYGRRTQLELYLQSKGKEISDADSVDAQIEFLLTELSPDGIGPAQGFANYQLVNYKGYTPEMWENAQSPSEAAIAFCWTFERPGKPRMDVRTEAAERYYNEFHGKERPNGGTVQSQNGDGYTQIYTASNGNTYKEYKQYMGSYKNILYQPYGKPIRSDGCSITAIAVILSGYGINVNPGDLANHNQLAKHIRDHGIKCSNYEPATRERMMTGKPMLVSISGVLKIEGSTKSYGGHYVAILDARGTDEVYVSDVGSGLSGWAKVDDIIRIVNRGIIYIE